PSRTHRVALQLSYTNAAGATVKVNPYYDFKFVPYTTGCTNVDGCYESVALTNPATETRVMANVDNCNTCHNQLALHGGGRVDVQYCVMCHNPGSTDANSGNVLTMATMVHKIHAGRILGANALEIWGYGASHHDYDEVGFPQDLRNCNKCHTASAATPQGDNWKSHPSREACMTCHSADDATTLTKLKLSDWTTRHDTLAASLSPPKANAAAMTNADCASCHTTGQWSAEQVHWNQNEENAAKYKVNIVSATFNDTTDHTGRTVTVAYYVSDPTNNNVAYDLNADCTGATGANGLPACDSSKTSINRFGSLKLYLAYKNLVGANPSGATDWSNSGGTSVSGYTGTRDGSNHYTVNIPVPNDTATAVAQGTARVISVGQVKEAQLDVVSRVAVSPTVYINVSQQNTYMDVALSGTLSPRRTVVSDAYCNKCHGTLGTTSGSNTLSTAFHSGARNSVIACVMCHDANKMSSTVMADGSGYNESYQAKRMIHGIHGGARRAFPFTHGNKVSGPWNKDGTLVSDGTTPFASDVENYTKEVVYPGILSDCTTCHVTDAVTGLGSFENDLGPFGAVISKKDTDPFTGSVSTDPGKWKVISPKAASCTACHDTVQAREHVSNQTVVNTGGMYGTPSPIVPGSGTTVAATQANFLAGALVENCNECHGPGQIYAVKKVHSGLANSINNP
ncbi:MAG: OmcA/MtrC family decaheme c-type cytochrome, partial [Hydrogenophilaceae bacterium]